MKTKTHKKSRKQKKSRVYLPTPPSLRFSPTAWAKLLFFRDYGDTEIGGFGITDADDLLYVRDFATIKQDVSAVSVCFDDEAVAAYFDDQVDAGLQPAQFARIWCHSHPGSSPTPSSTDEATFQRVFGRSDWAVMFVVAKENQVYARLRFNVGPGGQAEIPVHVDYGKPFARSEEDAWEKEYLAHIRSMDLSQSQITGDDGSDWYEGVLPGDLADQLELMEPAEREMVMEELSCRPDLWDDEGKVIV